MRVSSPSCHHVTSERERKMAAETPTVANVVSLQISLPQMLDLALGTPEVGVVNFNILHNFLHILLQQINLQTTKVEYRGENVNRIKAMVPSLKLGPALYLQEYNITDSTGKISERIREDIDVKIFTEDIQPLTEEDLKLTKGVTQQIGPGKESDPQTVIFIEPVVNGSPPTALAFKELEQSVKQLQQQYQALEDLSTTPEIVERLKGRNGDPIADIWQFININKRLDASEQGIEKLTTMVQDVIKGDIGAITTADMSLINARLDELEEKVAKMEQKFTNLQTIANIVFEDASPTTDHVAAKPITAAEAAETTAAAAEIAVDEDTVPSPEKEETAEEIPKPVHKTVDKLATQLIAPNNIAEIRQDVATLKVNVVEIQRELQDLNEKIAQVAKDKEKVVEVSDAANLEQCLEAVKNVETTHNKVMNDIIERVIALEKETEYLSEKVNVMQAMDKTGDVDINELVTKIQGIEADVERIGETIDRLFDDKEKKETHINVRAIF